MRLPLLKTLSYFMLDEPGTEIWEYLFPPGADCPQIETLNVSLAIRVEEVSDPCVSPLLSRFHTFFPNLKTLRHIKRLQKMDDDNKPIDLVCKHCYKNGVVTARCITFNPWANLHDDERHYKYDYPMHYLLRGQGSDPFLFFDVP